MKFVRAASVCALFLAVLLAACQPAGDQTPPVDDQTVPEVYLYAANDNTTVSMAPGTEVFITLASNPSTGYSWQVLEGDMNVIPLMTDPEYTADSNDPNIVGGGGTETFHFTANAVGTTVLQLGYLRPWEEGVDPIETFTVTIEVK
jgi:inhibitor of cysteine peptidase